MISVFFVYTIFCNNFGIELSMKYVDEYNNWQQDPIAYWENKAHQIIWTKNGPLF